MRTRNTCAYQMRNDLLCTWYAQSSLLMFWDTAAIHIFNRHFISLHILDHIPRPRFVLSGVVEVIKAHRKS
jgi:hypothetical protein